MLQTMNLYTINFKVDCEMKFLHLHLNFCIKSISLLDGSAMWRD